MLSKTLKGALLLSASLSVLAVQAEQQLPDALNQCLHKATYAERQSCLQMNIDLLRLQQELKTLATYGDTKKSAQVDYDIPQPTGVFSGPKSRKYAEFSYQDGVLTGHTGDILAAGWKVKRIGNASVTLTREGRDVVLGYGGGGTGQNNIPIMDNPIVGALRGGLIPSGGMIPTPAAAAVQMPTPAVMGGGK